VQIIIRVGFVKMQRRCEEHPCIYRETLFSFSWQDKYRNLLVWDVGGGGLVGWAGFCTPYLLCVSRSYPDRNKTGIWLSRELQHCSRSVGQE